MSTHKITQKQWLQFSNQITHSKQTIEQLSKLYIIIHEKVRSSIKKAISDSIGRKNTFPSQAIDHINRIKQIISKIKQAENDDYLIKVNKDMLRKYQKNLVSLLQQIEFMLNLQDSKTNVQSRNLRAIKTQKRQQHDLRDEIIKSQQRMIRSKSGKRITKKQNSQKLQDQDTQDQTLFTLIPCVDSPEKPIISSETQFLKIFSQKRQNLQSNIQSSIAKSGTGVSFKQKYKGNNLQMYLQQRRELADLVLNQEMYDKMIEDRSDKEANDTMFKQIFEVSGYRNTKAFNQLNDKLFPEFQIKTKFLRPKIKSNIINAIFEVKQQLLNIYLDTNKKILKGEDQKNKADKESQDKNHQTTNSLKKIKSLSTIKRGKSLSNVSQKRFPKSDLQESMGNRGMFALSQSTRSGFFQRGHLAGRSNSFATLRGTQGLGEWGRTEQTKKGMPWDQKVEEKTKAILAAKLQSSKI